MVSDREIDLIRARAAGVHTIHYLCKEVPQAMECDWRFSDDSDLAKALENACI